MDKIDLDILYSFYNDLLKIFYTIEVGFSG